MAEPAGDVEYERLEANLKLLAYATRLELLRLLRRPKTLDEIRLTPGSSQAGDSPERPISRQAVQNHLDQLADAGLVRVGFTDRKGKRLVQEFGADAARLFAVVEELRKIVTWEGDAPDAATRTETLAGSTALAWEEGAKLVLVHGVQEGRAFPLRHAEMTGGRGWIVGRAGSAHVSLEYDPYVSSENAEILHVGNQYRLLDLRTSRNGTFLNWTRLPVGGEVPLRSGDVVGVGRSLLVFRET